MSSTFISQQWSFHWLHQESGQVMMILFHKLGNDLVRWTTQSDYSDQEIIKIYIYIYVFVYLFYFNWNNENKSSIIAYLTYNKEKYINKQYNCEK